jgi:hypothetical protein
MENQPRDEPPAKSFQDLRGQNKTPFLRAAVGRQWHHKEGLSLGRPSKGT